MPPNLGGFFMVRSYYPSECHADYFDFERIEALKPAIEACGISTLSQSPMLGFHKQMDNRIKLLEEILCFFFSSRRRHTRFDCDWSSDVCSSDLEGAAGGAEGRARRPTGRAPADFRHDRQRGEGAPARALRGADPPRARALRPPGRGEIGRASCRERV